MMMSHEPCSRSEDMVNTELSVTFSPLRGIAGQYLELRAPQGFSFLERSFSPGEGGNPTYQHGNIWQPVAACLTNM